jgi:hypothetical protein
MIFSTMLLMCPSNLSNHPNPSKNLMEEISSKWVWEESASKPTLLLSKKLQSIITTPSIS